MEENSVFVVATCNCINTRRMLRATLLVVLFVVGLSDGSAVLGSEFNEEDTFGDDSNVKEDDPSQLIPETQSLLPLTCKQRGITFWLYQSATDAGTELTIGDSNICARFFPNPIPTIVIVHGFLGSRTAEAVRLLIGAYFQKGNNNCIVIDYSGFLFGLLAYEYDNVKTIAGCLRDLLNSLKQYSCMVFPNVHILGFSLGCHIAGYTGLLLQEDMSGKVGRITGMDPAGPSYGSCSISLNSTSASFVDCIHTSDFPGTTLYNCCHQNFIVNKGKKQPDCETKPGEIAGGCSHIASVKFYSYSVNNEMRYVAGLCGSAEQAITGSCPIGADPVYMGLRASLNPTPGIFQVNTTTIP